MDHTTLFWCLMCNMYSLVIQKVYYILGPSMTRTVLHVCTVVKGSDISKNPGDAGKN